jgi:hypothetical protein
VFRFLVALALVRLLAQSSGLDLLVDSCDTPCQESGGGNCSPGCDDCPCCPHQRPVTAQPGVEAPVPEVQSADFVAVLLPVQHPLPREIFHIPKHRLSV